MTLPRDTMLEIMAYADGELDDGARARVEAILASSAEARGVAAALGVLGEEVRDAVLGRAMPRADGIADAVMTRLDGASRGGEAPHSSVGNTWEGSAVHGVRDAAGGRAGAPGTRASSGPVAPVLPLVAPRGRTATRAVVAGVAVSALAIAAGYVFVVRSAMEKLAEPGAAPIAAMAGDQVGAVQGVEVAQLDSPDRSVSVMYLPAVAAAANADVSTVVIWIADEQASGDQ